MFDWCGLICETSQEHAQNLAVGVMLCLEATAPTMNSACQDLQAQRRLQDVFRMSSDICDVASAAEDIVDTDWGTQLS